MRDAQAVLNDQYLEMRWRALSLAADLDRVQRSPGGDALLHGDPRIANLRQVVRLLLDDAPGRAERVQMLLSDTSPRERA